MQTAREDATGLAMTIFTVAEFQRFWPQMEKTLDQIPHTWRHWTKDAIYERIVDGHIQLWGIGHPPDATFIMMTTVNVYPAARVLKTMWAVGQWEDDMIPLMSATFENYAKINGCSEIEVTGRPGWDPKFKTTGFKREAMVWTRFVNPNTIQ